MTVVPALPSIVAFAAVALMTGSQAPPARAPGSFGWPEGARAALSLSFDDGRASQLDAGLPLFDERKVRVTFYLTSGNIRERAADWRRAAAAGHEMGNHTASHPCSGNFPWSRERALETFTIDRMERELTDASRAIADLTGATPVTFAYPCGQTFVGRGPAVQSYVPLVSRHFLAGRGWLAEAANDPGFVDLAQTFGVSMDDMEFAAIKPAVDDAIARGHWLVLAGHDIGDAPGRQVTRTRVLRDLLAYVQDPARGMWVDTVARVARHIHTARGH